MYNMNVTNDAGQSAQAVALSTGGNNQGIYASSLLGWQDTAYVHTGTQFFSRCYIEGAVDFIFGTTANAWFVRSVPVSMSLRKLPNIIEARCHYWKCEKWACHGPRAG